MSGSQAGQAGQTERAGALTIFISARVEELERQVEFVVAKMRVSGKMDFSPAILNGLPYGTVKVTAVAGGLEIPSDTGNDPILIANAAVIVSFDDGKTG